MDVGDLDLPADLVAHYEAAGIGELYPPQARAVEAGVTAGKSVVAAVPTASGKTLIAQLAACSSPGKALYVVPLRALAAEKGEEFGALPGVEVDVATGDYDADAEVGGGDVVVATSEKVDSLIRHGAPWLSDLSCVIFDEVHLLNDAVRGPTLEVTAAKLRRLVSDLQVVALSATVANPEAVADWLDAALVESSYRPVDLREGVYRDGRIEFPDGGREVAAGDAEPAVALARDAMVEGGQCLVFVHSRRAAEDLAARLADQRLDLAPGVADRIRASARTDVGGRLADCARQGVAFHHAGLRPEHRSAVEAAFRERSIGAICATPTLAAGVNLPARRVVVRDHWRYTDAGREDLDTLEVKQMFGRAGRPGLDPYGEAVLIADSAEEAAALRERYVEGDPEPVTSKLASQDALRTHVLAAVASGFAGTRSELLSVLGGTFYAAREEPSTLADIADLVLDYLESADMLRAGSGLDATELGEEVSRLYVDPMTGEELVDSLEAAADLDRVTAATVLEIACDTPDVGSFYLRGSDRAAAYRFVRENEDALVKSVEGFEGAFDDWLATVKTVQVLLDWLDGAGEDDLVERHGIGPGDLRAKVERAEWLLNASESIAGLLDLPVEGRVREVREAMAERAEGVTPEP